MDLKSKKRKERRRCEEDSLKKKAIEISSHSSSSPL